MKNILILFIIISINLFGSCLKVSSNSGTTCSDDSISIDSISKSFTTTMKVSDNGVTVVDIPIYISTDSTEEITMTMTNITSLRNSDNETIATDFFYVVGGSEHGIIENSSFVLLANGAGTRDGSNNLIGYIRIKVTLSDNQTVGSYSLSKNIKVTLTNNGTSPTATLSSGGSVEHVTIVSFEDSISGYTSGEKFISAVIDYGDFNLNAVNRQIRSLYVKSNSKKACTISFSTSKLVSQVDSSYKIGMNYYYTKIGGTQQTIPNNIPFTIINGKNSGGKVGEMKFETETIDTLLIAGEYKAIINVTVSAR